MKTLLWKKKDDYLKDDEVLKTKESRDKNMMDKIKEEGERAEKICKLTILELSCTT